MHEVFEGNTFEGHSMLDILKRFQQRVGEHCKAVIVADAVRARPIAAINKVSSKGFNKKSTAPYFMPALLRE